jgi:beta-1,4-mannosyl-glycoprotein beta-1,4-N-acetylglucosaminyltransferase
MQIFDCVTFFKEFEQLKLRIALLHNIVDRFVVVEATRTHSGQPKPLYLKESGDETLLNHPKLVCASVEFPDNLSNWGREQYQREYLKGVLKAINARHGDLTLVSDVDEIPNPHSILAAAKILADSNKTERTIVAFEQRLFFFRLNYELLWSSELPWLGTCGTLYDNSLSPNWLRSTGRAIKRGEGAYFDAKAKVVRVPNGGSHFSYLGDDTKINEKLRAFAHQEKEVQITFGSCVDDLIQTRQGLFRHQKPKEVWVITNPTELDIPIGLIDELGMSKYVLAEFDPLAISIGRIRDITKIKKLKLGNVWIDYGRY